MSSLSHRGQGAASRIIEASRLPEREPAPAGPATGAPAAWLSRREKEPLTDRSGGVLAKHPAKQPRWRISPLRPRPRRTGGRAAFGRGRTAPLLHAASPRDLAPPSPPACGRGGTKPHPCGLAPWGTPAHAYQAGSGAGLPDALLRMRATSRRRSWPRRGSPPPWSAHRRARCLRCRTPSRGRPRCGRWAAPAPRSRSPRTRAP